MMLARVGLCSILALPCLAQEGKGGRDPAVPLLDYLRRTQLEDGSWPSAAEPVIRPDYHSSDQAVRAFVTAFAGWAFAVSGSSGYEREIARARDYCLGYLTKGHRNARANPTWVYSACVILLAYCHRVNPSDETREAIASGVRLLDEVREESGFWGHGRMPELARFKIDVAFYRDLSAAHNWAVIALARARWAGVEVPAALWEQALKYYDRAVDRSGVLLYTVGGMKGLGGIELGSGDGQDQGRSITATYALKLAGAERSAPFQGLRKSYSQNLAGAPTSHTPLLNLLGGALAAHALGDGEKFRRTWTDRLLKIIRKDGSAADWYERNGGHPDAETHNLGASFRTAIVALILQLPKGRFEPRQSTRTPSRPSQMSEKSEESEEKSGTPGK